MIRYLPCHDSSENRLVGEKPAVFTCIEEFLCVLGGGIIINGVNAFVTASLDQGNHESFKLSASVIADIFLEFYSDICKSKFQLKQPTFVEHFNVLLLHFLNVAIWSGAKNFNQDVVVG